MSRRPRRPVGSTSRTATCYTSRRRVFYPRQRLSATRSLSTNVGPSSERPFGLSMLPGRRDGRTDAAAREYRGSAREEQLQRRGIRRRLSRRSRVVVARHVCGGAVRHRALASLRFGRDRARRAKEHTGLPQGGRTSEGVGARGKRIISQQTRPGSAARRPTRREAAAARRAAPPPPPRRLVAPLQPASPRRPRESSTA